jgi:hypothetical protein
MKQFSRLIVAVSQHHGRRRRDWRQIVQSLLMNLTVIVEDGNVRAAMFIWILQI